MVRLLPWLPPADSGRWATLCLPKSKVFLLGLPRYVLFFFFFFLVFNFFSLWMAYKFPSLFKVFYLHIYAYFRIENHVMLDRLSTEVSIDMKLFSFVVLTRDGNTNMVGCLCFRFYFWIVYCWMPFQVSEPEKWGYSTDWKKVLVHFFGTQQM